MHGFPGRPWTDAASTRGPDAHRNGRMACTHAHRPRVCGSSTGIARKAAAAAAAWQEGKCEGW
jgi:hypothetical protein